MIDLDDVQKELLRTALDLARDARSSIVKAGDRAPLAEAAAACFSAATGHASPAPDAPDETWTWGRVGLMGQIELLGEYTSPDHGPTFRVRELRADGSTRERHVGSRALHSTEPLDEAEVRRLVVEAHAGGRHFRACETFTAAGAAADLCATCARNAAQHREQEARVEKRRLAEITLAALFGVTRDRVLLDDARGDRWNGEGLIAHVEVLGRKPLTSDEWSRALAAGVPLAALPPAARPVSDPEDDDIPFEAAAGGAS